MAILRLLTSVATQAPKHGSFAVKQVPNAIRAAVPLVSQVTNSSVGLLIMRTYTVKQVTKNLRIITTNKEIRLDKEVPLKVVQETTKPLVVIVPWLMAKEKHVIKFGNFYLDQGFDVLTVTVTPWQFLWPVKGSQVVATEMLDFLRLNYSYVPLIIHGFSVGGYFWGEVCVKLKEQLPHYQPIVDRIVGQIWDSAVEITEASIGVTKAVFPKNKMLQNMLTSYIRYHMKAFQDVATTHYVRSSQMFHTNLVKAPALFLLSKSDPVGTEKGCRRVADSWIENGVQVYWKCWDKSPHVGHYRQHPKEYASQLYTFLDRLHLVPYPEKLRAKM